MYTTDWLEEPTQRITKENLQIRSQQLRNGELVVLRDSEFLIEKEYKHFTLFFTQNGFPDNSTLVSEVKIKEDDTLRDLKEMILKMPQINPLKEEINP